MTNRGKDLERIVREVHRDTIRMGIAAGRSGAHFGSSLSLVHIMSVLVCSVANIDARDPENAQRDRIILSKGHGAIAYYAALEKIGFLRPNELLTYKSNETSLYAHPSRNLAKGIEASTGSLGLAAGIALGLRKSGNLDPRIFVVLGDGECNEGSVWESAMFIAHHNLSNVHVIVDSNSMQYDGRTSEVLDMGDDAEKWKSFGWSVVNLDGHDINQLADALDSRSSSRPSVVIARTVKGWGVEFMEGNEAWHFGQLSPEQEQVALASTDRIISGVEN